jgi:hypothetical protein
MGFKNIRIQLKFGYNNQLERGAIYSVKILHKKYLSGVADFNAGMRIWGMVKVTCGRISHFGDFHSSPYF